MWAILIQGSISHPDRVLPLLYGLPFVSVGILWWLSGFKEVSLGSATLTIRDSKRVAHVPLTQVAHVSEHHWNKGLAHITLVFRSKTDFGRRVRIMTGVQDIDRISRDLHSSIENRKTPNQPPEPTPLTRRGSS
jgi:hypothetical protein